MDGAVIESYDKSAEFYDNRDWQLFWERNEKPLIINLLNFDKYKKILDVGCGTGTYILSFLDKNVDIYGVDISRNMLEICRKKIGNFKDKKAKIYLFNQPFEHNNFEKEFFDLIIMTRVLCHFRNLDEITKQINRLLNNKGDFIVSDFHKDYKAYYSVLKNPRDNHKIKIPINTFSTSVLTEKFYLYKMQLKKLISISLSECIWKPEKGTSFDEELNNLNQKIFYIAKYIKN